jgi:hypothetical protein
MKQQPTESESTFAAKKAKNERRRINVERGRVKLK